MITVALSKGNMLADTLGLFAKAGYGNGRIPAESRRLVFVDRVHDLTFLIVRPTDVPTYVEYGAADVGVAGKDVLLEQDRDVYEPLDLRIGGCRISVAAPAGADRRANHAKTLRVATKYPRITERYFNQQGMAVEIIKLYGSIELAPLVGLADRIVDLVSSGQTLKAHDLVEVAVIARSTARLIVNRASLKLKHERLTEMIARLKRSRPRA